MPTSPATDRRPAGPAHAAAEVSVARVPGAASRVALGLAAALVAVAVVALPLGLVAGPPTGVEDNGDGYRLFCGAGLAPATADGYASWKGGVVTDFVAGPVTCDDPLVSAARLPLLLARALDPGVVSLATVGWVYAVATGLVAGLAVWAASAVRRARAAAVAVALAPVALPWFSRFFVSTYGEPAGLLGLVAVGAGLVAVLATGPADKKVGRKYRK